MVWWAKRELRWWLCVGGCVGERGRRVEWRMVKQSACKKKEMEQPSPGKDFFLRQLVRVPM